jgi:glycosyltransferase involved in cell wall biosynthesis
MKVGLYSPYFDTVGGGERYVLTVAEFFINRGDEVMIFDDGKLDRNKVRERFGINLNSAKVKNKLTTFGLDVLFFLSDGSIPFSFARQNILHFQVPFHYENQRTLLNKIKLQRFNYIVCNSRFTKSFIDGTYGINSEVLYPPVDVASFQSGKKENIILSVGRFFSPLHPKKQEVLIKAFNESKFKGWQLVLIGGGSADGINNLDNKNIKIITNSSFETLKGYYAKAKIYWHAAGFGEDLEKYPERAEHFGISTVEAMAAGAVPIVFSGGGQKEIVVDATNGFLWNSTDELIKLTKELMGDENKRRLVSEKAILRSKDFSKQRFFKSLEEMI